MPDGYFGVSAPETVELARNAETVRLERHAEAVGSAGLGWARVTFDWRLSELTPPVAGIHVYDWTWSDRLVAAFARHGVAIVPNAVGAPPWARELEATLAGCGSKSAVASSYALAFGQYTEAIIRRYGRGGAYWAHNPQVPYEPIERVEVWNEPNWHGSWCPAPNPEAFAQILAAGARGVRRADAAAEVVLGGLATIKDDVRFPDGRLRGMATDTFLQRLLQAEPALAGLVDTVGIHLYEPDPADNLSLLGWLRRTLGGVGLGDAELLITEFGWSTVGPGSVSEADRAENYREFLRILPRTDCGLSGIAPHSWFTFESDVADPEHWFGITDPQTAQPYASGAAFAEMVKWWAGLGATPAPRDVLSVCNAPPLDQDGDGWPDEDDDYPFDPAKHTGANEPPPEPDGPPPEPRSRPAAVSDEFFGATDVWLPEEGPARQAHYDAMRAAGLGAIRQQLIWDNVEPVLGEGQYEWAETDRRALALVRRGLRMAPVMINPPAGTTGGGAQVDSHYAALMRSLASRYGSQGSYWEENGHLDRGLAVRDYEVWQAGNARWGAWDGSPSPAEYARTYSATASAVRAEDPNARVIASLVDQAEGVYAGEFIRRMVAADTGLRGRIDGVYVMAAEARSAAEAEATAADVRLALEETGNGSAKLYLGFGAWTQGEGSMPEAERAAMVREIASALPRSDCQIDGMFAYAWATRSEDPLNAFDWYGVARLSDASLTPTGESLRDVARSFRGYGSVEPPRAALHGCYRQALDRDGDGAPDSVDSHPLDPAQKGTPPSPPAVPSFSGGPADPSAARTATLTYSASRAVSYQCRFDGGSWSACGSSFTTGQLSDGQHSLVVRGLDAYGVVGEPSEKRWEVDTRAPSVAIDSGPSDLILRDTATFSYSSNEAGTFWCQHDASTWRECGPSERLSGLADGTHVFRVLAVDRAGNASPAYAARMFETRTVPRLPSILSITGTPGQRPRATFEAAFAVRYECRYDEEPFAPCSEAQAHVPSEPLRHGSHRFYVRGIGGTGVAGPAVSAPVSVVDSAAPDSRFDSGPTGVVLTDSAKFTFSSDERDVSFWCRMDASAWASCPADGVFSGLADGPHNLTLAAVDAAGLADPSPADRQFEVRTQPGPAEVTLGPPEMGETGPSPRFEFAAQFAAAMECRFDDAPFGPCSEAAAHVPPEPLLPGVHVFEVRGVGGTGKLGDTGSRSFVVTDSPPDPAPSCRNREATIIGKKTASVIKGTAGPDVILALNADDKVSAGGGNDLVCASNGADTIVGGAGRDIIVGGAGRDVCRGGPGKNRLISCEG